MYTIFIIYLKSSSYNLEWFLEGNVRISWHLHFILFGQYSTGTHDCTDLWFSGASLAKCFIFFHADIALLLKGLKFEHSKFWIHQRLTPDEDLSLFSHVSASKPIRVILMCLWFAKPSCYICFHLLKPQPVLLWMHRTLLDYSWLCGGWRGGGVNLPLTRAMSAACHISWCVSSAGCVL